MAGPLKGSIEHMFLGASQGTGSSQSAFINAYNFFNNNTGTLGIRRIAYHTGSTSAGSTPTRGMNFYDQANPAGDNAWACFAFTSASVPFYVLVQWTGNAAIGTAPGAPCLYQNSAVQTNLIAFAFAQRADGGNPWNGSSGSNGFDTKGTPVWHPGASTLMVAPRSNDGVRGGSHGSSRQNTQGFSLGINANYRMSMVADYDNIAILFDLSADNSYAACLFGTYVPLSGVNSQAPYFSISDSNSIPFSVGTIYGPPDGTQTAQGGVSYPTFSISGTCSVGIDRVGTALFQNVNAQPNRSFATPLYNEFPMFIGLGETPTPVGMLGQTYDFFREAYNVATHDTSNNGTRAAFGSTTVAAVKLTIPWSSGTVPGSGMSRSGLQF